MEQLKIELTENYVFSYNGKDWQASNGKIICLGCSKWCGMNYCDEMGCSERTRIAVEPIPCENKP